MCISCSRWISTAIRRSTRWRSRTGSAGKPVAKRGARGEPPSLGKRPFWLALSLSARQLSAIRRYIRGNPARALWKKAHPDRFRVMSGIRHASQDPTVAWSAMGDPTLLASPFRFPVRLTRKLPPEAQEPALAAAVERARSGMVPVCGFLSPAERELERRLRAEASARWIKVVPHALPANHDPSQEDSRTLAEGRMLLLSSFSPEVPASPISRANCETMNDRVFALCGEAADPIRTGLPGVRHPGNAPDNFESFLSPSSFCKPPNERTMP